MWDKLIIALVIVGAGFSAGWWTGTRNVQSKLHDCQLARSKDQAEQERRNAQRAISNAETITRLRNERDAKEAKSRKIARRAAQRDAIARRELRDREQALSEALAKGSHCVVPADAIRLLDDAAGHTGLPKPPGPSPPAGVSDNAAANAIPAR